MASLQFRKPAESAGGFQLPHFEDVESPNRRIGAEWRFWSARGPSEVLEEVLSGNIFGTLLYTPPKKRRDPWGANCSLRLFICCSFPELSGCLGFL